jgi:hypothetical protein
MDVRAVLGGRRTIRPATVAIAIAVLTLVAAAVTGAWISRWADDRSTPRLPDTIPFDTTATTAPPVVAVLPPVPPASAAQAVQATVSTVTATHPVTSLQTVPPVRDLIVEIGGQRYSSDASGAIPVAGLDPHAQVVVIGVLADPPIQQVEFLGWADGASNAPRALRTLSGPVASLALSLSSRVTVAVADGTTGPATVEFDTEDGPVFVELGAPTWLLDQRAVRGNAGLTVQQLQYTAKSFSRAARVSPLLPQVFLATPEAQWVLATVG